MSKGNTTVEIKKRMYNQSTLEILLGLGEDESITEHLKQQPIPEDILNIAWVLDKPTRLPTVLKTIHAINKEDNIDVRLSLARAQIDAALKMNENLQQYTKQKFVAETIERMVFGNLLVEGKSSKNSNGNGDQKTEKKTKGKSAGKKKAGSSGKKAPAKK